MMASPKNLSKSKQHQGDSYNVCEDSNSSCLGSDHLLAMAEKESGTSSCSDSKEDDEDERWLQLGLGYCSSSSPKAPAKASDQNRRGDLVELDFFLPSSPLPAPPQQQHPPCQHSHHVIMKPLAFNTNNTSSCNHSAPLLLQYPTTTSLHRSSQQEFSWGYQPYNLWHPSTSSPSSSSSVPPPPPSRGMYYSPSFQYPSYNTIIPSFSGIRVIQAPGRPHSGLWFMFQASKNQAKEPFLPQIPRRYIRIKDGKMTVQLLTKYLVNKLRLDSESEVELTCRGQKLPHLFTLQHVRDNIWCSRNALSRLRVDSSTTDHIMVLIYSRSS